MSDQERIEKLERKIAELEQFITFQNRRVVFNVPIQVKGHISLFGVEGDGTTIMTGTDTPEGNVSAPVGTVYFNSEGGTSNTIWVKSTAATDTTVWRKVNDSLT